MNIYQKMDAITNELGVIAKDLQVSLGKTRSYKAVGERQILDAVKPLEHKHGVYSYPVTRELKDSEIVTSEKEYQGAVSKTNNFLLRISTVYRFVNVDDPEDYLEVVSYGDGIDTGDKAPGKAMTYADKYALMKAYKISTGDDPDQEGSPENGYKPKRQEDFHNPTAEEMSKPLEADVKQLVRLLKQNDVEQRTICEKYGVKSLRELTMEQMSSVRASLLGDK